MRYFRTFYQESKGTAARIQKTFTNWRCCKCVSRKPPTDGGVGTGARPFYRKRPGTGKRTGADAADTSSPVRAGKSPAARKGSHPLSFRRLMMVPLSSAPMMSTTELMYSHIKRAITVPMEP